MKILKLGDDVDAWKEHITCHYCKSEIEVKAKDLKYAGEAGDWHDSGWETYSFNCPACGASLCILPGKVPPLVKVAAQKRWWK